MSRWLAPILAGILGAGLAAAAERTGPAGSGGVREALVLLPLQDRSGHPPAVEAVEEALRAALAVRYQLVAAEQVRSALRRLRIRDSGSIPPGTLRRLAEELGAGAFFSATLHRAGEGQIPQVSLSGRLVQVEAPALRWAGFRSLSGLDEVGILGRGRVDDPVELARTAAARLVGDFLHPAPPRHRPEPVKAAFLLEPRPIETLGRVAVIPFDLDAGSPEGSEAATDLALAVLFERGASLAPPGTVEGILRQRGVLLRGEIDALTRAALRAGSGADVLFTGTVESYGYRPTGLDPEPEVGLAGRLLDAGTGRILWMGGLEGSGWDRQGPFQTHRIYTAENLAREMLESLVAGFAGSGRSRNRRQPR